MNQTANLISLIIATRKRVSSLSRLFDSIEATSEHPECIEVLLAVDDDDIDTINFVAKSKIERNFRIKSLVEKRGKGYVELHERINNISWFAGGKFLFLLPDDVRFMTNGWDKKVLFTYNNAYKDNIFWIRTAHNEVYNPWASCFGITREWYDITKHFGACYQGDTEFNYMARYVGREVSLTDMVIMHYRTDPKTGIIDGEVDQTYVEGRMAVDSGLVKGKTLWNSQVQGNIILDAINLLEHINSQGKDTKTTLKIASLYGKYILIKAFPILDWQILDPIKKLRRRLLRIG